MEYRILHAPVFSVVEFDLLESETVVAQPSSMLSMTSGIVLSATVGRRGARSGWWSGTKSMLGGENFFTSEYRAKRDAQTLILAPQTYGDILPIALDSSGSYYLTRGAYLANVGACELQIKYGGVKGWLSNKGLFLLHVSGQGTVFCQTYGAIVERTLGAGETFFVDNRFVIAFSDTLAYQLVKATQSVKDSLLSGEGLVNRYTGPGKLYYQTRGRPADGLFARVLDAAF